MARNSKPHKTVPRTGEKNKSRRRNFAKIKNKPLVYNFTIMFLGFMIVFFTLNSSSFFGIYNYKAGSVLKEDIYLQNDIVDEAAT
ncbi:MAG TPA: hypothetical protein VLS94_03290, partial [Fusibacter sp.]|nr:hypothetical protein [Fusibacter sp.]